MIRTDDKIAVIPTTPLLKVLRPPVGVSFVSIFHIASKAHSYDFNKQHNSLSSLATLSYDRLGVGRSDHPDGIQTVQSAFETAQLVQIASKLRDGSLGNGVPAFSKVVGLGHSYGSNLLAGVASSSGDAFDQYILTGFSANGTNSVGASNHQSFS
jgi:hypothetical protein